jgi:cell division septation protein DedD
LALKQAVIRKQIAKITSDSDAGLKKTDLGFYEKLKESDSKEPTMVVKSPPADAKFTQPKPGKDRPKQPYKSVKATSKPSTAKKLSTAKEQAATGSFTIQVASTKDEASADRLVVKLRMKGYPAYQSRAEIPDKGIWFRVRVGPYAKREAAEPILKRLKSEKQDGFIVKQ